MTWLPLLICLTIVAVILAAQIVVREHLSRRAPDYPAEISEDEYR